MSYGTAGIKTKIYTCYYCHKKFELHETEKGMFGVYGTKNRYCCRECKEKEKGGAEWVNL